VDGTGQFVNGNGDYLVIDGPLPPTLTGNEELSVAEDGTLYVQGDGLITEVGRLNIYMPANVETLQPVGENYFVAPDNNLMVVDNASIQSNMIEMSNVNLAQEMTNMILAQEL